MDPSPLEAGLKLRAHIANNVLSTPQSLRDLVVALYTAVDTAHGRAAASLDGIRAGDIRMTTAESVLTRETAEVSAIESVLVAADAALELADRECTEIGNIVAAVPDGSSSFEILSAISARMSALHEAIKSMLPLTRSSDIIPTGADGPASVRALQTAPGHMMRLETLDLSGRLLRPTDAEALAALIQIFGAPRLRVLSLSGCGLSSSSCEVICAALISHSPVLESVSFGCLEDSFAARSARNAVSADAATLLAGLPNLKTLDLRACGISATEILALAPVLPRLTSLCLAANGFGAASYVALSRSLCGGEPLVEGQHRIVPLIESLDVGLNLASDVAFAHIGALLPHLPRLTTLGLRGMGNTLQEESCRAFAAGLRGAAALTSLDISRHYMDNDAARAVTDALEGVPLLEELFFGHGGLYTGGMHIPFASMKSVPRLKRLELFNADYGDVRGAALIRTELSACFASLPALEHLNIRFNRATPSSIYACCLEQTPRLRTLSITTTLYRLDDKEIVAAAFAKLRCLEEVYLHISPLPAEDEPVFRLALTQALPVGCRFILNNTQTLPVPVR